MCLWYIVNAFACALKSRWSSIIRLFYILSAGLEAVMRSMKKSKERDTESKNQPVVASVSKLICTTRGQSSTLNGESINLHSTLGARDLMVTRFLSRPPHLWLRRSAEFVSDWRWPPKILPHAGTQGNKLQSWTKVLGTVMQYSHCFVILGSLIKQCILFEIFLQVSLPPPYTKLNLGKNSGYTRPMLFAGWGEGLGQGELENAQKCRRVPTLLSMIVVLAVAKGCLSCELAQNSTLTALENDI